MPVALASVLASLPFAALGGSLVWMARIGSPAADRR